MWFKHNMSIAQQMILIYNTTIPLCIRTKSDVALNVAKLFRLISHKTYKMYRLNNERRK